MNYGYKGYAKIYQRGSKWYGEVRTNIDGLYDTGVKSEPFEVFNQALFWVNGHRKKITKAVFG